MNYLHPLHFVAQVIFIESHEISDCKITFLRFSSFYFPHLIIRFNSFFFSKKRQFRVFFRNLFSCNFILILLCSQISFSILFPGKCKMSRNIRAPAYTSIYNLINLLNLKKKVTKKVFLNLPSLILNLPFRWMSIPKMFTLVKIQLSDFQRLTNILRSNEIVIFVHVFASVVFTSWF